LAGLWNTWTDKETGEVIESYTMLTLNADAHPLMNRMHRPDPKRPPNMQDKRSVVPIAPEDVDAWLTAPIEQAAALVRLAPAAEFLAEPAG
jgi:putative SOS response-associated peptidase YedK